MSGLTEPTGPRPVAFRREVNWWLMWIPIAGVAVAIAISAVDDRSFRTLQRSLEIPAPFIIGFTFAVYLARTLRQRSALFLLLGILTLAMTLREMHDMPGLGFIDKGVYVTFGVVVAWGVLWRDRIWRYLCADPRHTSWLAATVFAYCVALLIQRRAFRIVPGEQHIHRSLEECAETVAHGMFLITCLVGSWRRPCDRAITDQNAASSRRSLQEAPALEEPVLVGQEVTAESEV